MPTTKSSMPTTEEASREPRGAPEWAVEAHRAGPRCVGEVLTEPLPRRAPPPRSSRSVDDPRGLVAFSPQMQRVVSLARRAAKVDATVLITGQTGVGKELVARLIHDQSPRASGPFLALNCAALTEELLESELFGHVRGAFTGAISQHTGLVEAAHGGTLLLDEIGEMTPTLQAKLLRMLQDGEIRRVGEVRSRQVDVRFVAATNCDLAAAIDGGLFRRDLYYRLKVIEVKVPPLCDRPDDVMPLARRFQADACHTMARSMKGLSEDVSRQLRGYDWPGNVRELENAMERGVALATGDRIELDDLPEEIRRTVLRPDCISQRTSSGVRSLAEVEKSYVLAVLGLNEGNRTRTAEQLKIGTATLYRKLRSWHVDPVVHDGE